MNPLFDLVKKFFPGVWELVTAVGQLGLGIHFITEGQVEVGYALIVTGIGTIVGALRK